MFVILSALTRQVLTPPSPKSGISSASPFVDEDDDDDDDEDGTPDGGCPTQRRFHFPCFRFYLAFRSVKILKGISPHKWLHIMWFISRNSVDQKCSL